jgi:hypothetical protein
VSRWFRHYAGMMRDEKLVRVAVKSKQPVERVVWVWGAILESAAEINDGGRYDFDCGEAAYFLRCDDGDLRATLAGLEEMGRVAGGVICKWSDRQYDSDNSRERQQRYRDRRKPSPNNDSDVTPPSRDGEVTLQETETELEAETEEESEGANAPSSPEAGKPAPVAWLPCVTGEPYPVFESDIAEWQASFPAVNVRQQLGAMRSWLIANHTRRKTKRGMRRFVVTWLDKKQNEGGTQPRSGAPPGRQTPFDALRELQRKGLVPSDEPEQLHSDFSDAQRLPAIGVGRHTGVVVDLQPGAYRRAGSGDS